MNKWLKLVLLLLLFGLLLLIRMFESEIFYDPLLSFFKQDYLHAMVPEVHFSKLMVHTAFRFFLNTMISLAILYAAFRDTGILKFAAVLYLLAFLILFPFMGYLVATATPETNYRLLFYVRRFLIQPIFVLLLLPAFYYYRKQKNG